MEGMPAGLFVPKNLKEKEKQTFDGADSCLLSGQKKQHLISICTSLTGLVLSSFPHVKRVEIVPQLISATTGFPG